MNRLILGLGLAALACGTAYAVPASLSPPPTTAATPAPLDNSSKIATTNYTDLAVNVESVRAAAAEATKCSLSGCTFTGPVAHGSNTVTGSAFALTGGTIDGMTLCATTACSAVLSSLKVNGLAGYFKQVGGNTLAIASIPQTDVSGVSTTGETSAGTGLGTATRLTAGMNVLGTCSTGGFSLPLAATIAVGQFIIVMNRSGAACTVYPDTTGDTIELGTAGASVSVPSASDTFFFRTATGNYNK